MHADRVAHIHVSMKFSSPSRHHFHTSLKEHQSQSNGRQNYLQSNCFGLQDTECSIFSFVFGNQRALTNPWNDVKLIVDILVHRSGDDAHPGKGVGH